MVDALDAVLGAHFLAVFDSAREVGHGNFLDPVAQAANLGGDFGLEFETPAREAHAANHFAAEDFVAGVQVGDAAAEEEIADPGHHAIAEIRDAPGSVATGGEARAIDHVGAPVENRSEQRGNVLDVELEIGVLDHENVAGGHGEAGADAGTLALIARRTVQAESAEAFSELQELGSAVGRTIVHDDDFLCDGKLEGQGAAQDHEDGIFLVVGRNDDREFLGPQRRFGTGDGVGGHQGTATLPICRAAGRSGYGLRYR